ncbi:putative histone-lysine N-methyltransferase PRDM7 [Penaeus vannamei]|uniref:Putative histone-lysine N-methyltransferase PRDM7 n=1 Tax=Penaeus vannamei TaxID=6689 RepID=A0A3R7PT49_PENVA|nr:putative histone-lysine N-methyltransferase PRDM7 [Penaeus vannamei]
MVLPKCFTGSWDFLHHRPIHISSPKSLKQLRRTFRTGPQVPEFVVRQQRRRRNGLVAPTARPPRVPDDEGDDEWTPEKERSSRYAIKSGSVGGGRRGGLKRKAEWSAPAWTGRSENYDDAPLSVDQVDVIPLWTPAKLVEIMPTTADRSSGDSAAENVKPEDKGSFQFPCHSSTDTEMVTVKELPAESETLGVGSDEEGRGNSCFSGEKSKTRYPRRRSRRKLFYEESITKDDDFIYCADCEEEKEGECPYHPLFLILDNPVVRDGSEKDRARLTTPWPLTVCDSKVKGAGKGVWTNAHLPAHLVFGPYEGRVLSGHPEAGKESGYGWKIRGTGTRNTCIDAVDSAVSNWMRYVNCSRTEAETNLSTFQYKGQIYYKTDSAISRGSELMCWYGDDYGKDLGLSREPSKWKPAKKDVKDRQCEWCGLVYSSKDYLTRHLKVCRKRVHTYTPPIFSTRGTSSSSGSTKQCLREEAPQFPEKASHETLRSPASDEYNTECSSAGLPYALYIKADSRERFGRDVMLSQLSGLTSSTTKIKAQAQDPRKSAQSDSLGIRSTIRRWVRGTFRLLGRKRAMAEDAKQLFSTEEWLSFPEIEKNRFENILRNYKAMKDFGLDPKVPEFVVRQQRRRRNGLVAPTARPPRVPDDEGDDEISSTGTRNTCIDAVDSAVSNWMRYVNCSRTEAETNLSTFQYKGQIYYKTDSAISRGSELMCWYGDDYGKDLGLSREPSKWKPAKKDVKGTQIQFS